MGTSRFIVGYSLVVAYGVFMLAFLPGLGWFRRLGDYSYGIYLYGWPVQQCVLGLDPNMPAWKDALISCPIALGLGIVSWHFFEKPLLSMKDRAAGLLRWRSAG
jgi:peptidoglycan/LPS O-acetylase OafA/YrhL